MIQFDYPSGGIGRKERKRYTFSGFRGVDTSVAEINVDPIRAVESTNFVDRNGVLHKRYGWEQIYQFNAEINGFWRLPLNGRTYDLCYAGNVFYWLSESGWEKLYPKNDENNLVSRRTFCYVQNDKAYFIGCGDLLVFRLDNESGNYQMFRVVDDKNTFIPTTTAQILPNNISEKGLNGQYVRDGVNLLTGWRKNTLVGRTVPSDSSLIYRLDAAPKLTAEYNAYIFVNGVKHVLSLGETEGKIYPMKGSSVIGATLTTKPKRLNVEDTGLNFPDISYDAIETAGAFEKEWVLRIVNETGETCGLRWRREVEDAVQKPGSMLDSPYRAYTLYLIGNGAPLPILQRFYKKPSKSILSLEKEAYSIDLTWSRIAIVTIISLTVKKNDESDLNNSVNIRGVFPMTIGDYPFDIYIPAGKMETTAEFTVVGYGPSTNVRVSNVRASKTVYEKEKIVSWEEIEENGYIIEPGILKSETVNIAEYLSGNTATIDVLNEKYEVALEFIGPTLTCESESFKGSIDGTGALSVTNWGIEDDSTTANVTVEFYVSALKSNSITTTKYSALYGVGGEANRLFVANGNDGAKRNIIFFSEREDFTYFPDNFTKAVGGNANEVQGFIRLANGAMAALKTQHASDPTVFVFNGEYVSGYYDAEENEPYTYPKFSTSGASTTQSIVAPYACANLLHDSLFLASNGVYALELSQGTDSQRFAIKRSMPINNLLKSCNLEDLKEACAIAHENKYYLAVKRYTNTTDNRVQDGKAYYEHTINGYVLAENPDADLGMSKYFEREDCVYVADAHYSFTPNGAMRDEASYEWYPLTNIPVHLWFLLEGELYFGTKDGKICRIAKNSFFDVEKQFFAMDTFSREAKKYALEVKSITENIGDSNSNGWRDTLIIDQNTDIEDGDVFVAYSGQFSGRTLQQITDTDDLEYGEFARNLLNRELYIEKVYNSETGMFEGEIRLKYRPDDETFLEFETAQLLVGSLCRKKVVKANRTLPTFDFGMSDYLKTLESFTITMNGIDAGHMQLDIETRNTQIRKINMRGQGSFAFLNGLQKTSFNVPFQNSYTKRIYVRNFNYMRLKFYSEDPTDCAVSSISFLYKYNKASGGIK